MAGHAPAVSTVELQPTWLLHHTNYRDTSLIIDLFTLEHGRVSLMARSARSARPAVRALYQPFRPLLLSWTGESELKTLIGIEESGRPVDLDNRGLACAWYLSELLLRLLGKGQPQPTLFALYALALAQLAEGDQPIEVVLRTFELHLLEALGVLPDFLRATPDGRPLEPARRYRYHAGSATAVALIERGEQHGRLKPDRVAEADVRGDPAWHADGVTADEGIEVSGRTLAALAGFDLDDATVRDEARPLMKRLLRLQLGERPLKSRELFAALSGGPAAPPSGGSPADPPATDPEAFS